MITKKQLTEAQEFLDRIPLRKDLYEEVRTIYNLLSIVLNDEYIMIKKEVTDNMIDRGWIGLGFYDEQNIVNAFDAMLSAAEPVITE